MKVDAGLGHQLERVPASAKEVEAMGFDGVRTAEMNHDPFFPLLLAAEHTSKIELISSIAVGFARSPMLLANIGHDLNAYSKGRVTIGLGSQIKPHITKRFSMPWGAPAAKMRELVLAMRAIWANWYDGAKLEFVGKFYNHTLMTPAFTPENKQYGAPKVILAAVGPHMTEVAGEVADGMIIHPFSTLPFIEQVTLPAIERGLAKAGRRRGDFEISYSNFVVSGRNEEEFKKANRPTRNASRSRLDTGVSRRAGVDWCGRPADRTEHDVEAGPLEGDGHAHHRRNPAASSPWSESRTRSCRR